MGNYDRERQKCNPCVICMRGLKWIPVLFITAVIVWSYYAYVVQLCILSIENTFEKIVFLIFYHIICVLFFWSYWSTIFTPVGTVPSNWRIPESDIERIFQADSQEQQKRILENCAKTLPVTNRTLNGSVRFCEKCKIIKPDRAHHCSVCGSCVLKMDHHCPWVNNCVNFSNYKFFVLFLGYALLYCLYVALTSLEYFIHFWRGDLNGGGMGRFHILFLFFVSLMFAISLVSLFGYHVYLTLMNRTTLEAFRAPIFRIGGPDKNGYNLGKYANFQEVFGDNWKLWFLPVYTSVGDGLQYTTQKQHQIQSYDSMGDTAFQTSQDQLLREGDAAITASVATAASGANGKDVVLSIENAKSLTPITAVEAMHDAVATAEDKCVVEVVASITNASFVPATTITTANANGNVVIDMNNSGPIAAKSTAESASHNLPLGHNASTEPV